MIRNFAKGLGSAKLCGAAGIDVPAAPLSPLTLMRAQVCANTHPHTRSKTGGDRS